MQPSNIFNPEDWMYRIKEEFAICPKVKALSACCAEKGPTEVGCTTYAYVRMDLLIPRQIFHGLLHCRQLNRARYAPIKVATSPKGAEMYWLVVDTMTGRGYLLPFDAFPEEESKSRLPKKSESRAFA